MKKNSFIEGTVIATLIIVFVKILGMLYVIPFYKIVGSDGGALYSYAYNIYLIFLSISSAGIPNAIAKIISEYHTLGYEDAKNRAYSIAKRLISFISIVAFLFLFIMAEEIGRFIIGDLKGGNTYQDIAFVIRCVSPSVLVIPYLSVTKGYLQGHNYVSPSSLSQLIEQIVRILTILLGSYLVLKVFNGTLSLAIGIAVGGAFVGGLAALIYLKVVMHKNKKLLQSEEKKKDKITNKEIAKKIIIYSIPFIFINVVTDVYNFVDQILVLRTLEHLNFVTKDIEFIASAISTWSPKICMIINAMAMGMTVSLIPSIVSAFTKKDKVEVTDKINRSISMVFFISLPLALGLSILSKSVWAIFYEYNAYGPFILGLGVFSALCANVNMIVCTICQSLSKYKHVYIQTLLGFLLNALLDIPLMLLFDKLHLPAYLGSIAASMIGFMSSAIYGMYMLHKEDHIKFREMFRIVFKSLIPGFVMVLVLLVINHFITFNIISFKGALLKIIIDAIIGGVIYIGLSYKMHLLQDVLGIDMINRILKKLTFGKFALKN